MECHDSAEKVTRKSGRYILTERLVHHEKMTGNEQTWVKMVIIQVGFLREKKIGEY